jgi:hypothetical protein
MEGGYNPESFYDRSTLTGYDISLKRMACLQYGKPLSYDHSIVCVVTTTLISRACPLSSKGRAPGFDFGIIATIIFVVVNARIAGLRKRQGKTTTRSSGDVPK